MTEFMMSKLLKLLPKKYIIIVNKILDANTKYTRFNNE